MASALGYLHSLNIVYRYAGGLFGFNATILRQICTFFYVKIAKKNQNHTLIISNLLSQN